MTTAQQKHDAFTQLCKRLTSAQVFVVLEKESELAETDMSGCHNTRAKIAELELKSRGL